MPDNLEQELAALTPASPSPALDSKIEHSLLVCHASGPNLGGQKHASCANANTLHPPTSRPLSDRLLLSTLSLAAAAALLILTLLTTDYLNTPTYSSPPPSLQASLAQTQKLLAQLTDDSTANILPTPQSTQPRSNNQ